MPRTKTTRNHQGSIFKKTITKNGRKITAFDVRKRYWDEAAQKYKDRNKRCYSFAEAQTALANMPGEIKEQFEQKDPSNKTVSELIAYFRKEYVKPAVFANGQKIAGYKQSIETVNRYLDEILSFFGHEKLVSSVTYEDCRRFAEKLATTPTKLGSLPAPSTYHKKLAVLGRIFNIAIQLDWILVNPMKRGASLIKKRSEKPRNRMLTIEEEYRLLAECTGERSHLLAYVLVALDTGMRRGEIYNMRWRQVDFERKAIYLTKAAAKATKTGVEGILPLTSRVAEELQNVRRLTRKSGPDDPVLGKHEFKRAWKTVCQLAGIKELQFRDLRASAATRMLLTGTSGDLVRKITRHTRTETFLDHYTNIDIQIAQTIGVRLDEFQKKQQELLRKDEAKVEIQK